MSYIRLGLLLAAVAGFGLALSGAYRLGAAAERSAALTRSIEALRERSKTNETVKAMDDAALCRELGGVWSGAACE